MPTWIAAEHLVLIAGLVFALGYLITHQVMLRITILIGTGFYIWYYAVVADVPLWTAIWTSCLMAATNIIGLTSLLARGSKLAVPRAHRDIYPMFPGLPPGDFRELMGVAHRYTLAQDQQITTQGTANESLFFIISGTCLITKQEEQFRMPEGIFVGEVAYLNQQEAAATTVVKAGSEVLEWPVALLRKRTARRSRFKLALEAMISRDLANKVTFAVAPRSAAFQLSPPSSSASIA